MKLKNVDWEEFSINALLALALLLIIGNAILGGVLK